MMSEGDCLKISFHGRILDHLGIQMYQSPTAALAELVSNAWDADALEVNITLPTKLGDEATIVIEDNGCGMTKDECEKRYLNIGYCRRGADSTQRSTKYSRPILGRKGIGKFAGFGIAGLVEVDTVSEQTGERTVFSMDLKALRCSKYVEKEGEIPIIKYECPNETLKGKGRTTITLKQLRLRRCTSPKVFSESMSRRFLLLNWSSGFSVKVNGESVPNRTTLTNVEFDFPKDYTDLDRPVSCSLVDGEWGEEKMADGNTIRWRLLFTRDPIEEEELRGISVFAGVKLAQRPFFFNLTGGLSGQHGLEYMTGQVKADFIDSLDHDIISPERQRINWEDTAVEELEKWGQARIRSLLGIWRNLRGEKRREQIEAKVDGFSDRLKKLPSHERKTIKQALVRLGSIPALSDAQFLEVGGSVLTSWEQGRLKQLIADLADAHDLDEPELVRILVEQEVLTALNVAEAVRTKILAIAGLKERIEKRELENAIRDYIAENPWLIDPEYQTYKKEISLKKILTELAGKYVLPVDKEGKRIDLCLKSGTHIVVIEFMIPGKPLDIDHLNRYELYFRAVRTHVKANSACGFDRVTGLVVADSLDTDPVYLDKLESMRNDEMLAMDWHSLLGRALSKWEDLLRALAARTPRDPRLEPLVKEYLD
jgi:hypothetical protein